MKANIELKGVLDIERDWETVMAILRTFESVHMTTKPVKEEINDK